MDFKNESQIKKLLKMLWFKFYKPKKKMDMDNQGLQIRKRFELEIESKEKQYELIM